MPEKTLRIGIVGAGGIVRQRHWPGLRSIEGVHVCAVANSSPESTRRFLSDTGIDAEIEPDWRALVERPDLDIVWIGAHPNLHEPVTVAALEAGKHVFCQARMARDVQEAGRMLAAAEARPDLVTMLCPPPFGLRFDSFWKELVGPLAPVGPLRAIHLRSLNGAFLDTAAPPHWRQKREISGLNIMTLGIYTEVLQRWFGDIARVAAEGGTRTPVRHGYTVEIPEWLRVEVAFASGLTGLLEFSNIHESAPEESLVVSGENGELHFDMAADTVTLDGAPLTSACDRPWQVERDFINAVRNPSAPRPHPTFRDGLAYMRVVEAVNRSLVIGGAAIEVEVPN